MCLGANPLQMTERRLRPGSPIRSPRRDGPSHRPLVLALLVAAATVAGCVRAPLDPPRSPPGGVEELLADLSRAARARDFLALERLFTAPCRISCPGFVAFPLGVGGGYEAAILLPRVDDTPLLEDLELLLLSYGSVEEFRLAPLELHDFDRLVHLRARLSIRGRDAEDAPRAEEGIVDLVAQKREAGFRLDGFRAAPILSLRRAEEGYVGAGVLPPPGRAAPLAVPEERHDLPGASFAPPIVAFDVDSDGEADLVAAAPSGGRVVWYRRLVRAAGDAGEATPADRPFAPPRLLLDEPGARGREARIRALVPADVDGDGRTDLLVLVYGGRSHLYLNREGGFERADGFEIGGHPTAALFADLDGDARPDLFVVRHGERGIGEPDLLFLGRPGGSLVPSGEAADPGLGLAVCAADFDGDGDLDLFVVDELGPSRLYINERGRFRERAAAAGLEIGLGTSCAAGDLDGDGRPDLYVGGRGSASAYLLGRSGGASAACGVGLGARACRRLLAERTAGGRLWLNRSDRRRGLRFEPAPSTTLIDAGWTLHVALIDHDADGDLDLLLLRPGWGRAEEVWSFSTLPRLLEGRPPPSVPAPAFPIATRGAASLLVNLGSLRFLDGTSLASLPAGSPSAAVFDWDGDGDLDLALLGPDGITLARWSGGRTAGHSVLLRLEAAGPSREALGARVELVSESGRAVRYSGVESGQLNGPPGVLHFGVGAVVRAREVRVFWPGGRVETFPDLPVDTLVRLREGRGASWAGQQKNEEASLPASSGTPFTPAAGSPHDEGAARASGDLGEALRLLASKVWRQGQKGTIVLALPEQRCKECEPLCRKARALSAAHQGLLALRVDLAPAPRVAALEGSCRKIDPLPVRGDPRLVAAIGASLGSLLPVVLLLDPSGQIVRMLSGKDAPTLLEIEATKLLEEQKR
jgi:hypothetical protein